MPRPEWIFARLTKKWQIEIEMERGSKAMLKREWPSVVVLGYFIGAMHQIKI
jgi:hypothetical protein